MTVTIWQPGTTATHDQRVSAAGVFCIQRFNEIQYTACLLYTSDAADDLTRVDLGGRRIIKKKTPMWFRATETWAAAGLLSLARRKTTSCGNGWLETMRRHV